MYISMVVKLVEVDFEVTRDYWSGTSERTLATLFHPVLGIQVPVSEIYLSLLHNHQNWLGLLE